MDTFYISPDAVAKSFYESYIASDGSASGVDVFIHTDITIMPGIAGVLIPLGIRVVCVRTNNVAYKNQPFLLMYCLSLSSHSNQKIELAQKVFHSGNPLALLACHWHENSPTVHHEGRF